jgi:mono/diheme cytochrome c family protein
MKAVNHCMDRFDVKGIDMRVRSFLPNSVLAAFLLAFGSATAVAADTPSSGKNTQAPAYKVEEGYKVDAHTLEGFRAWRAAACDRCHGANQQGLVGPSLIEALKVLTPEQFKQTVTDGRLEKGMPSFKTSPSVMEHLDDLYTYLKGRSDGAITRAKVEPMQ